MKIINAIVMFLVLASTAFAVTTEDNDASPSLMAASVNVYKAAGFQRYSPFGQDYYWLGNQYYLSAQQTGETDFYTSVSTVVPLKVKIEDAPFKQRIIARSTGQTYRTMVVPRTLSWHQRILIDANRPQDFAGYSGRPGYYDMKYRAN